MTDYLLEIDNLAIEFAASGQNKRVVDGVSFAIKPGERFALVGESGSGKTVTALSILRLNNESITRYPQGAIRFAGKDVLHLTEKETQAIRGREVGMIFQEPMTSLNALYTIGDQLSEPLIQHLGMSREQAKKRAIELLARCQIPEPQKRLDAYPHMLSGGQRQRVMIAMALACQPKLLIADEPTTALDVTIQAQILALLEDLQKEFGMAVLMITHDLNVVRRFADNIAVMQQGKVVEAGSVATLFSNPQHPYTRRLLDSEPKPLAVGRPSTPVLLKADGVRCHFSLKRGWLQRRIGEVKAVDDVSFEVAQGETLGIVGESGSGKTTLGMCIMRLQNCEGRVVFDGRPLHELRQRDLRPQRRHFQVVFQDPFSSLSPRMTVEQIVGEGLEFHFPELSDMTRRERVVNILREVGLNDDALWRYPHEFSGGQRQRIAIARAVVLEPKLILLDEPTSSLDVSVAKQVLELLRDLQREHGISYLFISHDLRVIRSVAHRVLIMRHGRVVEEGETEKLFVAPEQAYTRELLNATLLSRETDRVR
ncbi:MAG TPA: ABC transporter ATP-binding protein [Burkholderiales bacterium]|nr:ABC transporter ATP-binding protein [Burkholderiales bacterium]